MTNITPKKTNILQLTRGGRLRRKVENEGFNTQKHEGYEPEHKYCRSSYTGLKNDYTLLQMACIINQFVEKSSFVSFLLEQHSKETVRNLWNNLKAYMLCFMPEPPTDTRKNLKALLPLHILPET
ncbi:MAG: hypothetical protein LBG15_13435 [Dysgonamonadaceae bacterium]|jgi:hypothetical protein|nr:hypothetical protein [Dysgonamonadaceae bacterium]